MLSAPAHVVARPQGGPWKDGGTSFCVRTKSATGSSPRSSSPHCSSNAFNASAPKQKNTPLHLKWHPPNLANLFSFLNRLVYYLSGFLIEEVKYLVRDFRLAPYFASSLSLGIARPPSRPILPSPHRMPRVLLYHLCKTCPQRRPPVLVTPSSLGRLLLCELCLARRRPCSAPEPRAPEPTTHALCLTRRQHSMPIVPSH